MTRLSLPKLPKLPKLSLAKAATKTATGKDKRSTPRLGIAELNAMGMDELKKHPAMAKKGKAWWEHAMDWIDLPRNAVANIVGGLAGVKTKGKDKGALGLSNVWMSDVLKKVGVKDKVVRGILGFVGDVAIDPLTYVGGASAVKMGGVSVKKAGAKKIAAGAAVAVAKGTRVRDAARTARLTGKLVNRTKKQIVENLALKGAKGDAARAFVSEFGRKGVAVAHIPFTGKELTVKAGRQFKTMKAISGLGKTAGAAAKIDKAVIGVTGRLTKAGQTLETAPDALKKLVGKRKANLKQARVDKAYGLEPLAESVAEAKQLKAAIKDVAGTIRTAKKDVKNLPWAVQKLNESKRIEDVAHVAATLDNANPGTGAVGNLLKKIRRTFAPSQIGGVESRVGRAVIEATKDATENATVLRQGLDAMVDGVLKRHKDLTKADVHEFLGALDQVPAAVRRRIRGVTSGADEVLREGTKGVGKLSRLSSEAAQVVAKRASLLTDEDIIGAAKALKEAMRGAGKAEVRAGLLKKALSGYFPHVMTDEAKKALTNTLIQGGKTPSEASVWLAGFGQAVSTKLPSSKHRTLNFMNYIDKNGEWQKFPMFTEGGKRRADKLMKAAGQADGAKVYVESVSTFDANKMLSEGRLDNLFGGGQHTPSQLFVNDPLVAGAERIRRHKGAMAYHDMATDITNQYGKMLRSGAEHPAPGWSVPFTRKNVFSGVFHPDLGKVDIAFPNEITENITTAFSYFEPSQKAGEFIGLFDKAQGMWKAQQLVGFSWPTINAVSNKILMLQGGFKAKDVAHYPSIFKMMHIAGKYSKQPAEMMRQLKQLTFKVGGQSHRGDEVMRFLRSNRVIDTGFWADAGEFLKTGQQKKVEMLLQNIAPDKLSKMGGKGKGFVKALFGKYYDVNTRYIENADKAAMFLSRLGSGDAMADAARATREALFDYARSTPAERSLFKRLFPFHSWMRNNTFRQFRDLMERPRFIASMPKLKNLLGTSFVEEQIPKELLPEWVRASMGVQVSGDKTGGTVLPIASYTPYEEVLDWAQEPVSKLLRSASPFLKVPFEIGFGKTVFGREIGSDPGQVSVGQHLYDQMRIPREVQRLGKHGKTGVTKALMGGRVQQLETRNLQLNLLRETNEKMRALRTGIRKALEGGDVNAQRRLAGELRLVLQERARLGLEVPKSVADTMPAAELPPPF